jgi:hypothetical protein
MAHTLTRKDLTKKKKKLATLPCIMQQNITENIYMHILINFENYDLDKGTLVSLSTK